MQAEVTIKKMLSQKIRIKFFIHTNFKSSVYLVEWKWNNLSLFTWSQNSYYIFWDSCIGSWRLASIYTIIYLQLRLVLYWLSLYIFRPAFLAFDISTKGIINLISFHLFDIEIIYLLYVLRYFWWDLHSVARNNVVKY